MVTIKVTPMKTVSLSDIKICVDRPIQVVSESMTMISMDLSGLLKKEGGAFVHNVAQKYKDSCLLSVEIEDQGLKKLLIMLSKGLIFVGGCRIIGIQGTLDENGNDVKLYTK